MLNFRTDRLQGRLEPTREGDAVREANSMRGSHAGRGRDFMPCRKSGRLGRSGHGLRPGFPRAAFSLLELLLVLALLVIVAGMALPSFRSSFTNQRLRKAGEQVRVAWGKARNEAMRSGRVYLFRYEVGSNTYTIEPWFREEDMLEGGFGSMSGMVGGGAGGPTAGLPPGGMPAGPGAANPLAPAVTREGTLAEGVVFGEVGLAMDNRDALLQSDLSGQPGTGGTLALGTPPIAFYPDGTTSTVKLALRNEIDYVVLIQLRGLTGLSKVSPLIAPGQPLVMP